MARNVLIIDDEEIFLDLLKSYLQEKGYAVTVSTSGQKILKLLFEKPYDIVLLDVWMVDMSGIEVFKKIRKANPNLPVVLMTGYAASSLVNTLQNLDVDAFIKKPFKLKEVEGVIEGAIEKRRNNSSTDAECVEQENAEEPEISAPSLDKSKYRILLADDDYQYRYTLREMFKDQGLETIEAEDGQEAWELYQANPEINVLVIDIKMPRMDGVELVKRIRERNPAVTAIFITGVDDKELHKELIEEEGAYAVFQKPFSYKHFLRFVEMTEQVRHAKNEE